ncbi:hypothetical protein ABE85_02130 [Mitsuaria sp. 7]|nr:hypothetical protein ABE85_02130 [Mitsuaria sp. 7]
MSLIQFFSVTADERECRPKILNAQVPISTVPPKNHVALRNTSLPGEVLKVKHVRHDLWGESTTWFKVAQPDEVVPPLKRV